MTLARNYLTTQTNCLRGNLCRLMAPRGCVVIVATDLQCWTNTITGINVRDLDSTKITSVMLHYVDHWLRVYKDNADNLIVFDAQDDEIYFSNERILKNLRAEVWTINAPGYAAQHTILA